MLDWVYQLKFNDQRNNIRNQISTGYIANRINLTVRLLGVWISSDISHCQKTEWFAKKRVIYLFPFYRIDIISLVSKTLQGFRSIWRNRNTKTIFCIRVRCFENLSRYIILKKTECAEYTKHTSTTCPCWRRAAETASPPSPAPTTATLRGVSLSKAMIRKESKIEAEFNRFNWKRPLYL